MQGPNTEHEKPPGVAHLLGYLNFSTSPADPAIFVALNETAVALATALPTFAHKNPALVEPRSVCAEPRQLRLHAQRR